MSDLDPDQPTTPTGEQPPSRRSRRRSGERKHSRLKVTLLTLLSMFLIIVLALGGFALYLNHVFNSNLKRNLAIPTSGQPTANPAAGDSQNILLVGTDTRSGSVTDQSSGARSDVIQLVHISNGAKTVQIVHFPRDLYVSIPGHGKNKINAAYAFGGTPLLVQTLNELLKIHIDYVASIDFEGFKRLTDDLGGVDIYVPQAISTSDTGALSVGYHHMNGTEALAFVRERHQLAEGDIDRGRDQQAWIKAIMNKLLSAGTLLNPFKLKSVIEDVSANTQVSNNMPDNYFRDQALKMRDLHKSDVTFYTAPFSGFGNDKVAGSIDIVDETKMAALGKALYDDTMSSYADGKNSLN